MSWGNLEPAKDKQFNDWYDEYVPGCGKAETLAGEIIRAINRIVYRYYNDGDTVDRYYGSEYNHNKACDDFLCRKVSGYETLCNVDDFRFEKEVCNRLSYVYEYLVNHPELFTTENNEDCLDNAPYERWDDEDEEDEW